MTELFDAVSTRLKAIFAAQAALELEAELIARHIERKASLLRRAAELEAEGLSELAAELRKHAGEVDLRKPTNATPQPAALHATDACTSSDAEDQSAATTTATARKRNR